MTTTRTVAVLGFHSDAGQESALRRTFEQFAYPTKKLVLHTAEREGELHTLSLEIGDLPIACIHADYEYPASYLDDLMRACTDVAADIAWTADRNAKSGPLEESNPDIYQSLVPAHVFRLLYTRHDRRIAVAKRNKRSRAVQVHACTTEPVTTKDELPNRLHTLNGLYWLVDYAHRMDRRCIESYLDHKKIGRSGLGLDEEAFLASLTPLQLRHLRFFLSSNIAGERAVDYLAKHIDLSKVKSALDVGSGYGGLVKALVKRGCAGTGLEIMKSLSDLAKINLVGSDAQLLVGDFLKADLPPESYDLVTMTDVIEHVASAEDAMARTARLLRPGGYAYIKVPNYRFIDHVREDAHTGLFGITLLRHDPAAAYLKAVRNMGYSVGDYHDYDYYIRTFATHGVSLVRSDNVQSPMTDLPKLLESCRSAFARWETEVKIEADMKADVRQHVAGYLRDFEERSKSRRRWLFRSEPDALFLRDYMTAHWNMFFQKQRTISSAIPAPKPLPTPAISAEPATAADTAPTSGLAGLAHVLSDAFQAKAAAETTRWDKEWMRYLSIDKTYSFYFYDMSSDTYALVAGPEVIAKMSAQELHDAKLCTRLPRTSIWAPGADLVGKDVLEVGCGPAVFGRMAGRFARSYTGVDVSPFALSIARLTTPKTCRFVHMYNPTGLQAIAKSCDVAVGRHFFIHHNYKDALWLLRFMRDLVRDGGLIVADFFSDRSTLDGQRRLTADADLSEKYPSALFHFDDDHVQRLCAETGLVCEQIDERTELSRRFARLRVPTS